MSITFILPVGKKAKGRSLVRIAIAGDEETPIHVASFPCAEWIWNAMVASILHNLPRPARQQPLLLLLPTARSMMTRVAYDSNCQRQESLVHDTFLY